MIDLGSLGGESTAVDVDNDVVAGVFIADDEFTHAFAYDLAAANPRMQDLGPGAEAEEAFVHAIDQNLVVGRIVQSETGRDHAFVSDLTAPGAPLRDLGDLDGGRGDSTAQAVSGQVVVGSSTRGGRSSWAFAEDLSAPQPVMTSLGSLGGHEFDGARDVDGDIVVGKSDMVATHNSHAFAYDLGAWVPRMSDLGPAFAEGAEGIAVSGNVVAASQRIPGSEPTRAVAWRLSTTTAPALRFTKTKSFVRENAGHVTIKVVRDGKRARRVRVDYSTRGIVARGTKDFTPTAGTLTFASGQTTASFRIPILNDRRREGRETFLIRLRNPSTGAIQGTPRAAAVVIRASDR